VTPDARVGDYDIELDWRGRTQRLPMKAPEAPWQDMWWGGAAENGWGVSVVQHRDLLFSVVYAYDAAGQPTRIGKMGFYLRPAFVARILTAPN